MKLALPSVEFSSAAGSTTPQVQTFGVSRSDGGVLAGLTIEGVVYRSGQPEGWLTVTAQAQPSAPLTISVRATATKLGAGTYSANVAVSASNVSNSPQTLLVTFVVSPAAVLALSDSEVRLAAEFGDSASEVARVVVTNGGGGTLSGLSIGDVSYSGNGPSGWLDASLNPEASPDTLTLRALPTGLTVGTYTATVSVLATDAANSPQEVHVTFELAGIEYGKRDSSVALLDVGKSLAPAITLVGVAAAQYTSRAPSVATVALDGRITAVGPGQAWITAAAGPARDSVWVIVPAPNGPVVRTSLSRYRWGARDTVVVDLVVDPRGEQVGAATLLVLYDQANPILDVAQASVLPSGMLVSSAVDSWNGIVRVTMASPIGSDTAVAVLRLRFLTNPFGMAGSIYVYPQEILDINGSSITSQTTATVYPIVVR